MDYICLGHNVLTTSRHFDIPEPTIRYWKRRYSPRDLSTLEDRSKRPQKVREPMIGWEVKEKVVQLRQKYPRWGKVKIQMLLLKEEGVRVGQSTIQAVINRNGLRRVPAKKRYRRTKRKHMYEVPGDVMRKPGGLVYLDVKHLSLPGSRRVYQFTAIDNATRLLYARVYKKITSESGKKFLCKVIKKLPIKDIKYVGSDNGSEFQGLLEKELKRRDIPHVFSSPRSPKQNPFVERVIRTMVDEVYSVFGTELNVRKQQETLNKYMYIYNHIRPHHGIKLRTPMQEYARLSKSGNS